MEQKTRTLWVIGDSTLSSFSDRYYYPRYGYGTMLDQYLDSHVKVQNLALSGRSSKSFTTEPEYQILINGMKQGDFLLIGFGHNDEKTEAGRYTNPNGSYREAGTFAESLYSRYVAKAEAVGCQTILCTPIVRRTPTGTWSDQQLHRTADTIGYPGGDYAEAIRAFGRAYKLPVIDMTAITKWYYEELGPDKTVNLHAWPSNRAISVDNTHTNIWGARVNAYFVMKEIAAAGIKGMTEHVILPAGIPDQQTYLVSDPAYQPTVYSSDLKDSTLWEEIDGFKGTAFGDIADQPSKESFTLEKYEDGSIHMAVRNNCGKIAAVSDGIAMYYKKVPVTADFVLTAHMKINSYFSNDQVSFGLMVRDDMYIDTVTPDILGDYVAAAPLLLTHGKDAWNCFARKSGALTQGGTCSRAYQPGDEVDLRIEATSDGYACIFGQEQTITGGFDFKLTSIDPENVYAGLFVSRNADVTFSNVTLTLQ